MKRILAVLLLVPEIAWAQTSLAPHQSSSTDTTPPAIDDLHSASYCVYPDTALRAGSEGRTYISFTITQEGRSVDVAVVRSSGDADLDRAAVACVSNSRANTASRWFASIVGSHREIVRWTIPVAVPGVPPTPPYGQYLPIPHSCEGWYPPAEIKAKVEGKTTVGFQITVDGDVRDPVIRNSSGNANLDNAAIECVKSWHYLPARQDGKPVEALWETQIVWNVD